jgi:site-specific recombinase XerD
MSKNTIYWQACQKIPGFKSLGEEFTRKLVINGRGKSTHENYLRQMSKLSLYYGRTPLELEIDELEEYLYHLIQKGTDSLSSYKHLVYGLRKLYRLFDREELVLSLPKIKASGRLPVILSTQEVKRLLKAPPRIRERVLFGLAYDSGLRIAELINLLISDIDMDRRQLHVRESKYKKDRYVPLSEHIVRGIRKHIALNSPKDYLFENSNRKGIPISRTRIRALLKEAVEKAGIKKPVCVHTFRHTYATHQLESGQNIMALKELLGHSDIRATLVYLHIAQLAPPRKTGCLDVLYNTNHE